MRQGAVALILLIGTRALASADATSAPDIRARLKPPTLEKVLKEQEIVTAARLDSDAEAPVPGATLSAPFTSQMPPAQRYEFHTVMKVGASVQRTREVVTDYKVYAKVIPYVSKAQFDPEKSELQVQGGIWRWQMASRVKFIQRSPRWVHYKIVEGSFEGLEGDLTFEPLGEKGTLVAFRGGLRAQKFPPRFIAEEGAQIVFSYTARRLRSYIESGEGLPPPGKTGDEKSPFPQPRRRIGK